MNNVFFWAINTKWLVISCYWLLGLAVSMFDSVLLESITGEAPSSYSQVVPYGGIVSHWNQISKSELFSVTRFTCYASKALLASSFCVWQLRERQGRTYPRTPGTGSNSGAEQPPSNAATRYYVSMEKQWVREATPKNRHIGLCE